MTDWRNDDYFFVAPKSTSFESLKPLSARDRLTKAGELKPTTKANKPYDKAFENALRHSRMRTGMRYIGD